MNAQNDRDFLSEYSDGASLLTVSPSPHVRHSDNSRTIMLDVLTALAPAVIWGIYIFGLRVITIVLVSVISCMLFEALTELVLRRPVTVLDFSAAVTGVLLAMNLPVAVPLWIPVVGSFFAIVIVKQVFGGIGKNIVNPALAARVFLFSWPDAMTTCTKPFAEINPLSISVEGIDAIASATPLVRLKDGIVPEISVFDMLIGNYAGVIGEVSAVLLTAGGIYLIFRKVITWHIPAAYITTVAVITYVFPQNINAVDFMLHELFCGGLFLGAIFMATDYTTSPVTSSGRLIYGAGCGLITIFIRYFGGYAEGVSFAILIMNLLVWYIDRYTKPVRFGGRIKDGNNK